MHLFRSGTSRAVAPVQRFHVAGKERWDERQKNACLHDAESELPAPLVLSTLQCCHRGLVVLVTIAANKVGKRSDPNQVGREAEPQQLAEKQCMSWQPDD
ncbi:hypothetical protein ACVWXN_006603 [Bradyrhizobium sp. i1.4.4]